MQTQHIQPNSAWLQHQRLIKLLQLINRIQTYIAADQRDLQSGAYNMFQHIREQTLQRISDRSYILRRLKKYYAKKLFVLAAEVYDDVRGI